MRGLAVAVLLSAPLLAGCLGVGEDVSPQGLVGALDLEGIEVPEGATLEPIAGGARLLWEAVGLPFEQELTIPAGTTMVRLTSELGAAQTLSVQLVHADTGRRRCQVPVIEEWLTPTTGRMSCAGLTAVDPLPTKWKATVGSAAGAADLVQVEFLAVPLDGIAAQLDLTQLSMPAYDLLPTESRFVESFDGADLYVQYTLPDGEGPWPVVIASSPYNMPAHKAGEPSMWTYFVKDWAQRGYAVVVADVRGFGKSGGCIEVWGPNEQRDQAVLVEWAASQPWSDGNVGFYGQSYVGTTPVAAAVQAPGALKAIIAVAPVISAYDDWHFGGVPNGEHLLSPLVAYQLSIGVLEKLDPANYDPLLGAMDAVNGICDPTLAARAADPRAIYDAFYDERNFSKRAAEVEAAVLYTQGFQDENVKSAMIPHWFNAITAPKLGVFGHWVHQHPIRADQEVLFLGWMDQYVKGKPVGFERLPAVDVHTNVGTHRLAQAWPPVAPEWRELGPDLAAGHLHEGEGSGSATLWLQPGATTLPVVSGLLGATQVALTHELEGPLHFAGEARLRLHGSLEGADNAYVAAFVYDVPPEDQVGARPVLATWGMANLAHRFGHDRYEPLTPGETFTMELPFLPTEHVFREGHAMRLLVRAAHVSDWAQVEPTKPGWLTLEAGGADGTALRFPMAPAEGVEPLPLTASH